MNDQNKTKAELIAELEKTKADLRERADANRSLSSHKERLRAQEEMVEVRDRRLTEARSAIAAYACSHFGRDWQESTVMKDNGNWEHDDSRDPMELRLLRHLDGILSDVATSN